MKTLTDKELATLPTKRLLAYKKKHFKSENYPHFIEDWVYDCNCEVCTYEKGLIESYHQEYARIKNELNRREHVV